MPTFILQENVNFSLCPTWIYKLDTAYMAKGYRFRATYSSKTTLFLLPLLAIKTGCKWAKSENRHIYIAVSWQLFFVYCIKKYSFRKIQKWCGPSKKIYLELSICTRSVQRKRWIGNFEFSKAVYLRLWFFLLMHICMFIICWHYQFGLVV